MPRYIDAEFAEKEITSLVAEYENRMPEWSPDDMLTSGKDAAMKYGYKADGAEKALEIVNKIPTADVQEVKHGRWIMVRKTKLIPTGYMAVVEGHVLTKTGADKPFTMQEANIIPLKAHKIVKIPYCSVCGNYGDDEYDKTPYCSYCGAKMDKKDDKDENN